MVTVDTFRKLALSFKDAEEKPHFEKASFRTKKIFATLNEKEKQACLLLTPIDQSVFCAYDPKIIYPVPNKWGKQGWTLVELKLVRKDMLKDALKLSYETSIAKKSKAKKN